VDFPTPMFPAIAINFFMVRLVGEQRENGESCSLLGLYHARRVNFFTME